MTRRSLPRCMYQKHGAYWFVRRNKWTRLGASLPAALREYARLIDTPAGGLDELVARTLADAAKTIKPNTLAQYKFAARAICDAFAEFAPDQVEGPHVAQFLDAHRDTPNMANRIRSVMKMVFDKAVLLGLAKHNPVASVPRFKESKRTRYLSDEEVAAIRGEASPLLAVIIDLCYLTGQRIGDVLKIKRADIGAEALFVQQEKTGARLQITMSGELREAIDRARALPGSVRGLRLFVGTTGGPLSYYAVRDQWRRAAERAGVKDAHLHDLRAKAGTDVKAAGGDSRGLLGHKSESAHARYLRGLEAPVVEPVRRRKS